MTLMDLSLAILAVCTLIQLGFFLYDRWALYLFRRRPVSMVPAPATRSLFNDPVLILLTVLMVVGLVKALRERDLY